MEFRDDPGIDLFDGVDGRVVVEMDEVEGEGFDFFVGGASLGRSPILAIGAGAERFFFFAIFGGGVNQSLMMMMMMSHYP